MTLAGGEANRGRAGVAEGDADDDVALMARLAARDASALAALYDRHSPTVLAVCIRVLRDRAAAEELLVEVFEEVWTHAARYDAARGAPSAYLVTLARSRAIDRLRSRARQRGAAATVGRSGLTGDGSSNAAALDPADGSAGPLERVLLDERGSAVRAALSRLEPLQRDAIEFAFYEGLSHTEVAERLQRPLGTVKSGIRRGLLKLRDLLLSDRRTSTPDEGSAGEVTP